MSTARFMSARSRIGVCFYVLTILLAFSPAATATCSNANLQGVFGYFHGRPGASSFVVVGQLTLDGQGSITSASYTLSSFGTISTGTTTGTYSISENCTGTFMLNGEEYGPGIGVYFNIYLNAGNKMCQIIEAEQQSNQPGFGLAQGTVTCGLFPGEKRAFTTNLVGGFNGDNVVDAADTVGRVTLDGKGNISGTETFTNNGVVTYAAVTGTYTENSTCTGIWQITPTGGTATTSILSWRTTGRNCC